MKKTQTLVCILFGLTVFFAVVLSFTMSDRGAIELQVSFQSIPTAIGIFVAGAASFSLLLKSLGGATIEQLSLLIIPLMAGVLLIQVHWSVAMPLGLLVVGFVMRDITKVWVGSPRDTSVDAE